MKAYAIAHLQDVVVNDDIVRYLERIDATLAPLMVAEGGAAMVTMARP